MSSDELVIPWINAFKKLSYIFNYFPSLSEGRLIWLYLEHLSGFSGPYNAICLSPFKHNAGTVLYFGKTRPVVSESGEDPGKS